jgi:hypothetical protein
MAKVTASKMDAACAQLDAAIEMYFTFDNPIATHTLTMAAYNILRDFAKNNGSEHPFLKTRFLDEYPKSKRAALLQFINGPENFFKHADNDPTGILTFDPEITETFLIDACAYFRDKDIPKPKYYDVLKVWLGNAKVDLSEESKTFTETFADTLPTKGKAEYWKFMSLYLATRQTTQ